MVRENQNRNATILQVETVDLSVWLEI